MDTLGKLKDSDIPRGAKYAIERCFSHRSVPCDMQSWELLFCAGRRTRQRTMPWSPKVLVPLAGFNKRLCFLSFFGTTKTPTVASESGPKDTGPRRHVTYKSGVALRFPFEFRVSVRRKLSLRARSLHEARLANEAIPRRQSLQASKSERLKRAEPSAIIAPGRAGKRDPP